MRNSLLCTVGTSFFAGNLKPLSENRHPDPPRNSAELIKAYNSGDWKQLAKEIFKIGDPTKRVCGAEINTIEEVRKKNWLSLQNIVFLVSDTDDGINTGKVLTEYFRLRSDITLRNIEYSIVSELQDKRPKDFKIHGLRNLVRKIGEYIQRFGGINYVAIDATGGYKAQIAIAVVIGQALNIPVYYKHEFFSELIDFPPLPVSLDYEILANNADILTDFERGKAFTGTEIGNMALQSVFGEEFDFIVEYKQEINSWECTLLVKEGDEEPCVPKNEMGSGILDVLSLALRVVMWSIQKPASRAFIYMDEPMKAIGRGILLDKAMFMIKSISEKLGIQFIINTHVPEVASLGDKSFEVIKDGRVSEVREMGVVKSQRLVRRGQRVTSTV